MKMSVTDVKTLRCPDCSAGGILWKPSLWRGLSKSKKCPSRGALLNVATPWWLSLLFALLITIAAFLPFLVLAFCGGTWFVVSLVVLVIIVPVVVGLLAPVRKA